MNLAPGTTFAWDYRIERPLGAGGMGSLFVVEQISTGQRRALKLMNASLVSNDEMRRKFDQEARVGAKIDSEHVVQVVASGVEQTNGTPFLVMELLEGEHLGAAIDRRGPFSPPEVAEIFDQLCHAVGAAHAAGIVHRDLKPENVFLARSRRAGVTFTVKVLDFGIAKLLAEGGARSTAAMGSPMWLAPEQTERGVITPGADVWALGLIAFFLVTGRPYWRSAATGEVTVAQLLREVLFEPLVPASTRATELGRAVPPGFDAVFARAVTRNPGERFPDARAFGAALASALGRGPAQATASTDWRRDPSSALAAAPTMLPHQAGFQPAPAEPTRYGTPASAPGFAATPASGLANPTPPNFPPPPPSGGSQGGSSALVIGIAGGVLLLLAGGAAAAVFALRGADRPEPPPAVIPVTSAVAPVTLPSASAAASASAAPAPDPREDAIAAWVAGPLIGNDNGAAAMRSAHIVRKGAGYALTIDNQFKFTCDLEFDAAGTPKTLKGCVSGLASDGWSASPGAIPVNCVRANGYESCAGSYRLRNDPVKMNDPGVFNFSRQLGGTTAVPTPKPTAPTTATTAPTNPVPPTTGTGTISATDVQRVIAAARPRFSACYNNALKDDPSLSGRVPLDLVIGPDGSVVAASVSPGATLTSSKVQTCMLGVARSLTFPAPSGGSATVKVPFVFANAKD